MTFANRIHMNAGTVNSGDKCDAAEYVVMFLRDVCDGTTSLFHQHHQFRFVQEIVLSSGGCRRHAVNGTRGSSILSSVKVKGLPRTM